MLAVDALACGISVICRKASHRLAGVEQEHFTVLACRGLHTQFHGFLFIAHGVFPFSHLYRRTPTTKVIWRKIFVPELAGDGQCNAMQHAVTAAHTLVAYSAVLQQVAVAVLLELLPAGCHQGGSLCQIVLRAQIVHVIGLVNPLNLV